MADSPDTPDFPGSLRVLVVSDSHLSERTPEAEANWEAAVAAAPDFDLVIHAGDLSLDGASGEEDLLFARSVLDRLPVPWLAVPGNHDVGDCAYRDIPATADQSTVDRWIGCIGPDRWSVDVGGWTVVGVDAQLFGGSPDMAAEHWDWLQECLATRPQGRPVLFVTHKPVAAEPAERAASSVHRFVPADAAQRIDSLLSTVRCPIVLSGHVHQYRSLELGGRRHVWAPTSWAVLPERAQKTVGLKRCGVLSVVLEPDGTACADLAEPPGLKQLTIGDDFADPYGT